MCDPISHLHPPPLPTCAEADPGPRQQQPVSGQSQRGGQPGAQRQRLHTLALPTVAAPQRHTTGDLLITLCTPTDTHIHALTLTHAAAQSEHARERTC